MNADENKLLIGVYLRSSAAMNCYSQLLLHRQHKRIAVRAVDGHPQTLSVFIRGQMCFQHPDALPAKKICATRSEQLNLVSSAATVALHLEHGLDQIRAGLPHGRPECADEFVRRGGAGRLDS